MSEEDDREDQHIHNLYAAHALATFCERGWEFAIGLFILEVFPNSLLPVAAYGVAEGLVKMLGGGHAGAYIDSVDRLSAVKKSFALQNIGNALSSVMNWIMIYSTSGDQGFHSHDYVLLVMVVMFGSVAAVGNMAAKIAVQRDWAKVLFEGDSEGLAQFNATMKAIDLSGLILSPMLVGLCMDFAGVGTTALAIPIAYALAYPVEVTPTLEHSSRPLCLIPPVYTAGVDLSPPARVRCEPGIAGRQGGPRDNR